MAKIIKKIRDNVRNIHSGLLSGAEYFSSKYLGKYKIDVKIRFCNIWARRNKRLFFAGVIGVMIIILAIDISSSIILARNNGDPLQLDNFSESVKVFDNLQTINRNNEVIRRQKEKLSSAGELLISRLDSLTRITHKSHEDSVKIVETYHKLELINNFINNETEY